MSEPIEPKQCPACGKKMLLRFTGVVLACYPPIRQRGWRCGCGHREAGPDYREPHPDENWERLNAE